MSDTDPKGTDAARAAWLYYHEEMTQNDVARALDVSRSTVTRLLQRAKTDGLVQISLNVPSATFKAERALESAYGLQHVRIVPHASDGTMQKRWLGQVAGEMLVRMMTADAILAVSWGTTMQAVVDSLVGQLPVPGTQIVAIVGGLHNASLGTGANEIASQLGQFFGAEVRPLLAPIYVQDEATAQGLMGNPAIRDALRRAAKASAAIFSAGALDDDATMLRLGYLNAEQKRFLRAHGAVGEFACRWIDRNGAPVDLPPTIHPICISMQEFKAIPQRLAVAGEPSKREIVRACLRGGFATRLVTDEHTAGYLLGAP